MKCLFLLNKLIKENALPSILVLASTAVRSTATLAKTQKHRDNLARFKRAWTVSRLRIFYFIMIKGNSSELPFLYIESQSRHLTAYDALLLRLTTKGRSRSQKRRPKHVPRTFYFLQPMLVLIRFFNKYNHHQSNLRRCTTGKKLAKAHF